MTKTCGICGHAALDDQAQFCNRCGAAVPEERKPAFPVCPGCGTVVSDEMAQFCNRCGMKIPPVPVVCGHCGSPAIDNQSRFCTRCGTTFEQKTVPRHITCPSCGAPDPGGEAIFCNRCGTPFSRQEGYLAHQPGRSPVIIAQRKHASHTLQVNVPDTDWEPWSDEPATPASPRGQGLAPPEQSAPRDQKISLAQKKYAHLPLVADEMRKKADTGDPGQLTNLPPSHKKAAAQKKGVLGFMKK